MIKDPAAQEICRRCGAWLPVRPDFAEFRSYIRERPDSHYRHRSPIDSEVWSPFTVDNFYCDECVIEEPIEEWRSRFSCLDCGWPRERTDARDPLILFPADPRAPATRCAARTWPICRRCWTMAAAASRDGTPSTRDTRRELTLRARE